MENSTFIDNSALAEAVSVDYSDTIATIQALFIELARHDAVWGINHGADRGKPARFEGWGHPALVAWASSLGHGGAMPLRHVLTGPELYFLQLSLEKKLATYKQGAIAHG